MGKKSLKIYGSEEVAHAAAKLEAGVDTRLPVWVKLQSPLLRRQQVLAKRCGNPTDEIEQCVTVISLLNRLRSSRNKPTTRTKEIYVLAAADAPGWFSSSSLSELKFGSFKSSTGSLLLVVGKIHGGLSRIIRLTACIKLTSTAISHSNYAKFHFSQ